MSDPTGERTGTRPEDVENVVRWDVTPGEVGGSTAGGPGTADADPTHEHATHEKAADEKAADENAAREEAAYRTVEDAVRAQLTKALGGIRGVIEAAVPTAGFTVAWVVTRELKLALGIGAGLAIVLLVTRLVQRQTVQFVANSLFGIAVAAFFALRSGKAEDAFLPGILYNAGYAVVMTFSVLVRWPVVGFLVGTVTGDPTGWRRDPGIVRLCSRLTWFLIIPCLVRVAVQYPLYNAGHAGWLGAAKIAMGWPLQVAGLGAMIWLLARGRTPLDGDADPATSG